MALFLILIGSTTISLFIYMWIKITRLRKKLKWIPETPKLPIFGNIFDFKKPTELLNVFGRYLNSYDGLCSIELLTQKIVLCTDPEMMKFILSTTEILNKSEHYKLLSNWLEQGLLTSDGEKWKKTRKILNPSFHFSFLTTFIDIFEKNSRRLVELLDKETTNDSVDVLPYLTMSSLDVICEAAMGTSINAQNNPKSDYVSAVREMCRFLMERAFSPIKMFDITYCLTPDYYKELKCVKFLHSYAMDIINSRQQKMKLRREEKVQIDNDMGIKRRKVFLDLLLEANIDGKPLTDREIRQEVDTFIFAGYDTTALAIGFTLYSLSIHRDIQEKAVEEQKQIFGNDRNRISTIRDLQEMKYLELIIKESLRLYPPVAFIARTADRDIEYKDGNIIPNGTTVLILIYWINRNPKYFPCPDKFDPSRFEDISNLPPYTYVPFSAGPRNCIGQKFAWLEMKSVISKILRNYVILSSGHKMNLIAETFLKSSNGMRVKLRKRVWNNI
ncbi:cytochrome P450 4d8-like isoform X1 [Diorhabda carinulata]|uniref:cytochrome P450 4d8-like isoform X1 n=1 Tax=Diorhabda carinulata TaxID=1163345 RepID=UPI0025A2D1A5|nr:cytochrome P450 4d8-like isoform X1 [Diorhabda carinulata]